MRSVGANLKATGESMRSVGTSLSLGVTVPLVGLGYAAANAATQFQASMELIRTQAGATQNEVDAMTTAVLNLSRSGETAQGPDKLAEGLYHLESLGLRGKEAIDALRTSAQAADLGLADMEGVTNALGAAIVTGIKGTEDYSKAMGLLDATIGQGNMRMDDMVAALGTGILPAAKNFGLTLQDVGAALATLTDNGMRADESATRLRMTFSLIAAPTQKAKDALAEIGLSAYQLANDMRGPNGLVTAVDDLKAHLENSGKSATEQAAILSEAFGGGRSSAAILTLVQQSDRLKTKFDAIGQSADTFQEKVAATHETNLYKLNEAMAQIQTTLIDLGGTIMPMVAAALQFIARAASDVAAIFSKIPAPIRTAIVVVLALVAAIGPLLVIFGTLLSTVGTVAAVFGIGALALFGWIAVIALVIGAVVALGIVIYENWDKIKKFTADAWAAVVGYVKAHWQEIIQILLPGIGTLAVFLYNHWTQIKNDANAAWSEIKKTAGIAADEIVRVWQKLTAVAGAVWNGLLKLITTDINLIVGAILVNLNALDPQWRKQWQALLSFLDAVWNDIRTAVTMAMRFVTQNITAAMRLLSAWWTAAWTAISQVVSDVWTAITSNVTAAAASVRDAVEGPVTELAAWWKAVWQSFRDFFKQIWNDIASFVDAIITKIIGYFQKLANEANKVIGSITGGFGNTVISGINTVIGAGAKATGLSAFTIPHFASGGIVTGPTIALIGEAGPEAVVPLSGGARGGLGGIVVNINGGYYLDQNASRDFANMIAKSLNQQLRLRTI